MRSIFRCAGRLLALGLALCLFLTGCTRLVPDDEAANARTVYCTFYPLYALTQRLTEGIPDVSVQCLVQPQDGCLRSYELSDWDLYLLAYAADVVVAGGRGLESFESQLYALGDTGPTVITAFTDLTLHNEDDPDASSDEATHLDGANPHLYMSVTGMIETAQVIAEDLAMLDADNAAAYAENLKNATAQLEDLRTEMLAATREYAGRPVILLNEALIYTVQELSLEVADWYERESGTELSENELSACLEAISDAEARVVLVEKQAPESLVSALEEEGLAVARIDILSAGRKDMGWEGYLSAQRANAQAIVEAFASPEN